MSAYENIMRSPITAMHAVLGITNCSKVLHATTGGPAVRVGAGAAPSSARQPSSGGCEPPVAAPGPSAV